MKNQLLALLEDLWNIGSDHAELYDTEVREQLGNAIMEGFVRANSDFGIPNDFGMYSSDANLRVKTAIAKYVSDASAEARALGIESFQDRLAAFQDRDVQLSVPGMDYEEFFGHTPPEFYDQFGNVVRTT